MKLTCRDCGETVEWWRSEPVTPFVAPAFVHDLTPDEIEDIRADRWKNHTRSAVLAELGPLDAPHAADAEAARAIACPGCKSERVRKLSTAIGTIQCIACELIWEPSAVAGHTAVSTNDDTETEREQLALDGLADHDRERLH